MAQTLAREILILFMIMAGGFALVKSKVLKGDDGKIVSKVIIYLITPCVIINSFQVDLTPENTSGFLLSLFAAFALHILTFAVVFILGKIFRFSPIEKTAIIYSNCGNLVIPLISTILGQKWVMFGSVYMCVQQFFVWSHGQSVIEGEKKINIRKVIKNVNVISVFIGFILFLTNIRFPVIVDDALYKISSMIGPLSMVMIGMIMAEVNFKEVFTNKRVYFTTFFKMIVIPLVMTLIVKYSGLSRLHPEGVTILYISLLPVMAPSAVTVVQLAQLFDNQPKYASSINVLTTVCCIATMPLMTLIYYA